MKRRHLLLTSAVIGFVMSILMFVAPATLLNDTLPSANPMAEFLMRIMAVVVFCFSVMNILARRDGWSDSMKAILSANLLMHALLLGMDLYGYVDGLVGTRSVVMSIILHGGLAMGFVMALMSPSRQEEPQLSRAS